MPGAYLNTHIQRTVVTIRIAVSPKVCGMPLNGIYYQRSNVSEQLQVLHRSIVNIWFHPLN